MRTLGLFAALCAAALAPAQNLEIYTIDVEGGKAVLSIGPTGESMLVEATSSV